MSSHLDCQLYRSQPSASRCNMLASSSTFSPVLLLMPVTQMQNLQKMRPVQIKSAWIKMKEGGKKIRTTTRWLGVRSDNKRFKDCFTSPFNQEARTLNFAQEKRSEYHERIGSVTLVPSCNATCSNLLCVGDTCGFRFAWCVERHGEITYSESRAWQRDKGLAAQRQHLRSPVNVNGRCQGGRQSFVTLRGHTRGRYRSVRACSGLCPRIRKMND